MHSTQLGQDPMYHVHADKYRYIAHHDGDYIGSDVVLVKATKDQEERLEKETFKIPFEMLLELVGCYLRDLEIQRLEGRTGIQVIKQIEGGL